MSDLTEPLHGRAADEVRDQLRTTPTLLPFHDLLAAIVDTLDVPSAANYEDIDTARRLLGTRAGQLRGYLRGMVEGQHQPDIHADGIRRMTADTPVTYVPYASPRAAENGEGSSC
ncbi:hypothetical protein [Streptomyces liangshanensis]|uniref:hypothetical protein n=1 Tax=Streptomyces liangshanensis TaxID=2717324 RepID=UPI0036DC1A85